MKLCLREEKVCIPQFSEGWHKLNNNLHFEAHVCTRADRAGFSVWVEGDAVWLQFYFASQTLIPAGWQQLGGLTHYEILFPQQQGVQTQRRRRE